MNTLAMRLALQSLIKFKIKRCALVFFLCYIYCFGDVFMKNDSILLQKSIKSWSEIKDTEVTRQQYDYSCGSASLSTILSYYYNIPISEKEILDSILKAKGIDINKKEEIQYNDEFRQKSELSFLDLSEYAKQKGFKALGLALDLESLTKLKAPVIMYVKVRDNEHFTVYKGMDAYFVYLADPSFGNIKVSKSKFQEMFYQRKDLSYPGKILAFVPNDTQVTINQDFIKKQEKEQFLYEVIKDRAK